MAKTHNPAGPKAPSTPGVADKSDAGAKAAATPLYLVGATPILRDGKRFEPGSPIALSKAQADRLGLKHAPKAATAADVPTESNLE